MTWAGWALLSALFAGATALLAKLGIAGVPSNLAMAIRTSVILVLAWGLVLLRGEGGSISSLTSRTWLFLVLSAIATGASWLCYFQALALGPVSRVAPIDKLSFVVAVVLGVLVLKEHVSWQAALGCVLIVAGVLLTLIPPASPAGGSAPPAPVLSGSAGTGEPANTSSEPPITGGQGGSAGGKKLSGEAR